MAFGVKLDFAGDAHFLEFVLKCFGNLILDHNFNITDLTLGAHIGCKIDHSAGGVYFVWSHGYADE